MSRGRITTHGGTVVAGAAMLFAPSMVLACGVCIDHGMTERGWWILPTVGGLALGFALEAVVSMATSRWTGVRPEWPGKWTIVVALVLLALFFGMMGVFL